jgi:anaerobic carbon-monoxide dehydrogenase iron sulfur subunit
MFKSLIMDAAKCTSCLQCEMACSYHHTGAFNPARSRIKIFEFGHGERSVPYTCTQCSEAWCLHACPVNAIAVDIETGAKVVNDAKCVGCKVCTIACPYGTINYSTFTRKVVKCDLCDGDPACARICPTDAIIFGDPDALGSAEMSDPSTITGDKSDVALHGKTLDQGA